MASTEAVYQPPPVEKIKPVEKRKKAKARKKNQQKKYRLKSPNKTEKKETGFTFLMVLFLVMILAGAVFLAFFGQFTTPIWVIGLLMMFIGNLGPWLTIFIASLRKKTAAQVDGLGFGITLIFILVFDFLIGLTFFIWGLVIGLSLFWGVGIVFLVIFAIIAAIFFHSIYGR